MGFFSWITQDTGKSIANRHSVRPTFPVTMTDNKGNKWHEKNYDGYGEFGGKDYYELIAEMNGKATGDLEADRLAGIRLELGVNAIQHKITKRIYKSGGLDFFNWATEILPHGLSANASVDTGEWDSINIVEENVLLPNLTEDENHVWIQEAAEHCSEQGFFYSGDDGYEEY